MLLRCLCLCLVLRLATCAINSRRRVLPMRKKDSKFSRVISVTTRASTVLSSSDISGIKQSGKGSNELKLVKHGIIVFVEDCSGRQFSRTKGWEGEELEDVWEVV